MVPARREQGHADAQFQLGYAYWIGRGVAQDDEKAVMWYRRAAERGCADTRLNLGYFTYRVGRRVTQDEGEAARWYRVAAASEH